MPGVPGDGPGRLSINLSERDRKTLNEATALSGRNQTATMLRALELYTELARATQEHEPGVRMGSVVVYYKSPDGGMERTVFH